MMPLETSIVACRLVTVWKPDRRVVGGCHIVDVAFPRIVTWSTMCSVLWSIEATETVATPGKPSDGLGRQRDLPALADGNGIGASPKSCRGTKNGMPGFAPCPELTFRAVALKVGFSFAEYHPFVVQDAVLERHHAIRRRVRVCVA